jgi:glycosyltransferase involved in cell wall biosynthesis
VYLADAPYPHTWRWVEHFARAGADCEVISFRPATIAGARVHHIDGAEPLGKARYLLHARRIKQLIHSLQPDLVHALHLTSYGFLAALSGARPLVISVWGTDILEAPGLTPFHRWLTRYALARADVITATGLHLATETTRYTPQDTPVTVVPYGVDLEAFQPAPSRDGGERPIIIGATSRLSPEKGVRFLIDAFAAVRQRFGEGVHLRLAGDGPERSRLEARVKQLGLEGAVKFHGWLEHNDLPAFLQGLDIFALPSVYEGFGVSAAEASAAGLPVVASSVHGIPDVVRDGATGFLTPPRNPQAIANACIRLVEDAGLRQRLGAAGRDYIAQHYSWADNIRQMELIYQGLTNGKQNGSRPPVASGGTSQ